MVFERTIFILIIFQSLLFISFLLFDAKAKAHSNRFLAGLLLNLALHMSLNLCDPFCQQWCAQHGLPDFRRVLAFCYGPFFYLYLRALVYRNFKTDLKICLHFIPAVLAMLLSRFIPIQVIAISIFSSVGGYLLAGILLLRHYHRVLQVHYSQADSVKLDWVYKTLGILAALFIFDICQFVFELQVLSNLVFITLLVFVNAFVLQAMRHPDFFSGIQGTEESFEDSRQPELKTSQLSKLKSLMEKDKPYLDSNLTLSDLAQAMNLSARECSQLINQGMGCNFPEYINSFRIEEAKWRLQHHNETVLETLYAVGFNSKSSFNTLFKKTTGMTPTQYRVRHVDKNA